MSNASADLPRPLTEFFDAVNACDFDALANCLSEDVSYQFLVPHPPVVGREAVIEALRASLTDADRVSWELLGHLAAGPLAFVERVDRFWFAGHEAAIDVVGVFELADDTVTAVRDYADLDTWRQRKAAARNAGRPAGP
ncbi:DUF4440 domain-containing protein [Gordonia jinghuaiqii]|uniref:Nuclear transport factor 2 family protein n=1 Tax=Gordonia jinghuaiqii TaxID=2758710 RepID=A0A7D7M170_9ACTN|nr:nuclear transport factor 2 family protein [Gordonia jinghuaiqii]MCR5976338.1 DUF4440 domain-containing protein [Gordonia jinghuaiqii]QMT03556.1 nuclear transport factor 2 family protein [Gordonia jinghuaiqii]